MSVFEERIGRDFYLQHMKDTMDWIERKMREAEEEAAKDPTLRKKGYDVGIYVEARWLKQLIAECVGKHQMLTAMQREVIDRATAWMSMSPPPYSPKAEKDGKS